MRVENTFDMLRRAVAGNSTTARQLAELGLAGGAGVALSGGNVFDPRGWLTGALLYGARRGVVKIDQGVARRVGEMLSSNDPNVVQQAYRMAANNPAILKLIRYAESNVARIMGPTTIGGVASGRADENN